MALHNGLSGWNQAFIDTSSDQRASPADGFCIETGTFLGDARGGKSTDQTTRGTTRRCSRHGTDRGRNQPTRGYHWTDTRNGKHPKPSEQTGSSAQGGASRSAGSSARRGAMCGFPSDLRSVGSVRHNANFIMRYVSSLKILHGLRSCVVRVV